MLNLYMLLLRSGEENNIKSSESSNNKEHILCAAIWYNDGIKREHQPRNIDSGIVVCGWRHHNCFAILNNIDKNYDKKNHIQGFLTSQGKFVNRKRAFKIAKASDQIVTNIKDAISIELTSEDLY